jgi:16S rRNA (adenine1518-N6/adenine1519-N6)-dimethyltransferase
MPHIESGELPAATLRRHGLTPRKRLGQSFLRDRSFLAHLINALEIEREDAVLEIGAGTGVLTRALAKHAGHVVAVELDDSLYRLLEEELASVANIELWHGNALDFDPCEHMPQAYKLAGNIPYYLTGPILRHFLETQCQPRVLVLMVQREVAERIVAPPGQLSMLGVSVQAYAHAKIVARVPPGAFFPRPKVESSIVRLTPHSQRLSGGDRELFFQVVRAGFSTRRKQLLNALGVGLNISRGRSKDLLRRAGLDETRRAETLSIDDWQSLARAWSEEPPRVAR